MSSRDSLCLDNMGKSKDKIFYPRIKAQISVYKNNYLPYLTG